MMEWLNNYASGLCVLGVKLTILSMKGRLFVVV